MSNQPPKRGLAEQKFCQTRRKALEAPMAYSMYVQGVRAAATKYDEIYAREGIRI